LFLAAAALFSAVPFLHVPLGWAETFFHETSHGLAAVLTGGRATRLELRFDGSGTLWSAGGARLVVAFAGYAGAVVWGGLVYLAATAASPRWAARVSGFLALFVVAVAARLGSLADPETMAVAAAVATVFAALWRWPGGARVRLALRFVGAYVMVSGMRAPTYVLFAGGQHNDAETLSGIIPLPQGAWVALWLAWGAAAILVVHRTASRRLPA
jgi:hypothetical protein